MHKAWTFVAGSLALAAAGEATPGRELYPVAVVADGAALPRHEKGGVQYVEAAKGREYVLRITNPTNVRVAAAVSVDGLNTLDGKKTTARLAKKWLIAPYQTIEVKGWQVSADRVRRFEFTTEKDSYGAKLGQTSDLGTIGVAIFRDIGSVAAVTKPIDGSMRGMGKAELKTMGDVRAKSTFGLGGVGAGGAMGSASEKKAPLADDGFAATAQGRAEAHRVSYTDVQLEATPSMVLSLRYEYRPTLVRLGVVPASETGLERREKAEAFKPEYAPELPSH